MSPRILRTAIAAVAGLGAGLAGYLTATSLLDEQALCPTSGCEVVLSSRYSELLGLPVSAFGAAAFAAILLSALHSRGALPGAAVALGGLGFALYLVLVQALAIGAFCLLCLLSHALLAAVAALTVLRLLRADG